MSLRKAKVIGNGLVAKSLKDTEFSKDILIFASGVSNSKEYRSEEFAREKTLFKRVAYDHPGSSIVYFSSTSVSLGGGSRYLAHKLEMEEVVKREAKNFFIFRLPQVVGPVDNLTLVSFLTKRCLEGDSIDLYGSAVRNLLGVDELAKIVNILVEKEVGLNSAQIVASGSNVSVVDVALEVKSILSSPSELNVLPGGDDQTVSIDLLRQYLDEEEPIFQPDYWKNVLNKFVPLISEKVARG